MAWSPQHVLAGGDFTTINRVAHGGVAQFTGGDSVSPTAVTDLTVSSTAKGRVDLSWSPVSDSDSPTVTYRVYRRPTSGTFALLSTVSGATGGGGPITWSDATATIGASYQYQVRAADPVYLASAGNTAGPVTVAGDQVPPGTPIAVSATATAPGVATISWQGGGDSDDPSVSYAVTRWTSGGSTALPPMTGAPSGTVTTTDALPAGGTVWYSVTASDGTFTSPASAVSNTIVIGVDAAKPTVPTGLAVSSDAANTMTVSWTASTDADLPTGQIQYVVYRKLKTDSGTGTAIGTTAPGVTSYTDLTSAANGPLPDKAYTYYVAATDGAQTSAKTAGLFGTVSSSVFTDAFSTLSGWTPPLSPSGASLDTTKGHGDASSALLTSLVSPRTYGYLHRSFGGSYPTVCIQEWVALTAYDTRGSGQTTLMRVYSTGGLDVARLYVDPKGALWVRGDFGSNPAVTTVVVPADGSWHSAQLCTTTTPDSVNGSLTVYWDGVAKGTLTGVDNSPDLLASMDVGDTQAENYTMWVDDVNVGTTKR
jgi:hypothetical protein